MFNGGVVAVAGSRALPAGGAALVAEVAQLLVGSGCSLVVGCCRGADVAVLSAVPVSSVRVLCAFGPAGQGAGPASAVGPVLAFASSGGTVAWWAGGGPSVPLFARLARRTRVVVSSASSGLVLFPSSPESRGSWLAAELAVARGLPVVVVPLGFAPSLLPSLGAGGWVCANASGVFGGAWSWVASQGELFD
jgi:hypothetical protein